MEDKKMTAFDEQSRGLVSEVAKKIFGPRVPIRQGWANEPGGIKGFMEAFNMPTEYDRHSLISQYPFKPELVLQNQLGFKKEEWTDNTYGHVTLLEGHVRKCLYRSRGGGTWSYENRRLKRREGKDLSSCLGDFGFRIYPSYAPGGSVRQGADLPCGPHTRWIVWVCPVRLDSGHHVHAFVVGNGTVQVNLRHDTGKGLMYYSRSIAHLALVRPE